MLTGVDQFIDRVRAQMLGATDYLTKPFADRELLMLVEKYLNFSSNGAKQQVYAYQSYAVQPYNY
jgi:DNA-binding response OmpR family regulator